MVYCRADMVRLLVVFSLAMSVTEGRLFKLGLLTPMQPEYDFSGLTSAGAVSLAIEKIHSDPYLNDDGFIQLR